MPTEYNYAQDSFQISVFARFSASFCSREPLLSRTLFGEFPKTISEDKLYASLGPLSTLRLEFAVSCWCKQREAKLEMGHIFLFLLPAVESPPPVIRPTFFLLLCGDKVETTGPRSERYPACSYLSGDK